MVYKPTYNWGGPPCGAQSRFFLWFLSMSSQVASSLSPWCNGLQLLHGMARSRLRLNVASMAAADKNGGWEMLCGALRHMEVGKWGSFGVTWGSLGIPEMMGCCEWDFLGDFNRILWTGSDRIWWALDGFNISPSGVRVAWAIGICEKSVVNEVNLGGLGKDFREVSVLSVFGLSCLKHNV